MAILISKQKAQCKRAISLQAIANSTLTESLFLLEDTMKGKYWKVRNCRVGINGSRHEAREIMRQRGELNKENQYTYIVHHKDGNPLNNSISNLEIIERRLHKIIHTWMKKNLL